MISVIPFWAWWLLGFIAGFGLGMFLRSQKKDGSIHVTPGVGEKPDNYLFEFNVLPEKIPKMKQVIFKVQIEQQKIQSP